MDHQTSEQDAAFLARLQAGDADAFDALVKNCHGPMLRIASAIAGPAQAEEIVQEAWLAAVQHLAGFEGRSGVKTWLISIVRNQAINRIRQQRREILTADMDSGPLFDENRFKTSGHWARTPARWHDDSPEALLSQEDFRRCLEKTLEVMPDNQRAALLLRDQEEMPLEEICNILSLTASNIRVIIHRARVRLHGMIEHYEETGKC